MRRLNRDQIAEAHRRWQRGEYIETLAYYYGIHPHTMKKYLRQFEKGVVLEWQE
jgi:hypothetical protein